MFVKGARQGDKIIPSGMPDIIKVSFGCKLTSNQTKGTPSFHEHLVNKKGWTDGGKEGWEPMLLRSSRQRYKALITVVYLVIGFEK